MYLSSSDGTDNMNVDGISQIRPENTSPFTSHPPPSPTSSFPALLVVDDNSTSDDSSFNPSDIPVPPALGTSESTDAQGTPPTNVDNSGNTLDQQRRRNSSIAKLLGGQPLNNQQYEDIHQRVLDDQTAQNLPSNGENSTESPIPRSRSSITRTLLMNAERNMNGTQVSVVPTRSISPSFPKDFEYLIRRELDIEHAPSTLHRNSSTPSVFQNLSSARNTSPTPSQSKLKRKRTNPKQTLLPVAMGRPAPFELDTSSSPSVSSTSTMSHHHQNDLYRFNGMFRPQSHLHHPVSDSPPLPPFSYYRQMNTASSYGHLKNPPISSHSYAYPAPIELALPTPVSALLPHSHLSSTRKNRLSNPRVDLHESPIQRLQLTSSNPSSVSSSSSSSPSSSGQSAPLKKRLLHAYKNERWPSSSL